MSRYFSIVSAGLGGLMIGIYGDSLPGVMGMIGLTVVSVVFSSIADEKLIREHKND